MREKINIGFTNKSFKEDNLFIQEININEFNHKINYQILSKLNFVPKLLKNSSNEMIWEYIDGSDVELNQQNLKIIAQNVSTLHNSNLEFPQYNIDKRIKKYIEIIEKKNIDLPFIRQNYPLIEKITSECDKSTPNHNDLWTRNMIKKDQQIFIVDWEYATMNDKHFDLAYFICSSHLNEEQEKWFLQNYDDEIDYKQLLKQKLVVYYIVVLWVLAQDTKFFDETPYIQLFNQTKELIKRA
ncbi:phosphotransferase [Mycoplasmopsis ciconiae]|uniref:Phosphotransferase n=1 Tax=Mycoplasmopsis ciconiae TaxID=561067 RepID=A0ABU7MLK7_9BACT|nr:phosphotransferase [Mycoplasmopsis ciconiae]